MTRLNDFYGFTHSPFTKSIAAQDLYPSRGHCEVQGRLAFALQDILDVLGERRIAVCRDVRDDKVLEAAVAGEVDAIVTGDKDLLVLDPFEGIPIVEPAAFLRLLD